MCIPVGRILKHATLASVATKTNGMEKVVVVVVVVVVLYFMLSGIPG